MELSSNDSQSIQILDSKSMVSIIDEHNGIFEALKKVAAREILRLHIRALKLYERILTEA